MVTQNMKNDYCDQWRIQYILGVFHYEKFMSNYIDLMKYLLQGLYNLPNYTKRSGLLQIQKRIPNTIMKRPMLFTYKTEPNLPYLNHCLHSSIHSLEKLTIQGCYSMPTVFKSFRIVLMFEFEILHKVCPGAQ